MSSVWGGKGEEEKVGSLRESDTVENKFVYLLYLLSLIPYVFTFYYAQFLFQ